MDVDIHNSCFPYAPWVCSARSRINRAKNTVNILFKNTSIVAIGLLTYALCGFSLMYPGDFILGDWLGFSGFGLNPGENWNTPSYNV